MWRDPLTTWNQIELTQTSKIDQSEEIVSSRFAATIYDWPPFIWPIDQMKSLNQAKSQVAWICIEEFPANDALQIYQHIQPA